MEKDTDNKNEQSSAAVFEQLEVFVTAETNTPVFIKPKIVIGFDPITL